MPPFPEGITDHSDGTECASCCGAFRKSWFPSLYQSSVIVIVVGRISRWSLAWGVDELILPVCLWVIKSVRKFEKPELGLEISILPLLVSTGAKCDELSLWSLMESLRFDGAE